MCVGKIRGVYSTHFHTLIDEARKINSNNISNVKIDFLVAEVTDGERRTYKICRRQPDGQSFARSIANRYGISFEKLLRGINDV